MEAISHAPCPRCRAPAGVLLVPGMDEAVCRFCRADVRTLLFPALRPAPPPLPPGPEDAPREGESACYYNPLRKATASCAQCGVFISDAWKAKWGNDVLCLRCLDKLHNERRGVNFEQGRVLWDNIVLLLALVPFTLVLWWAGFLAAPAALVLGIWSWHKPRSLVPRGRWRLVAGLMLATVQVAAILIGIYFLVAEITSR